MAKKNCLLMVLLFLLTACSTIDREASTIALEGVQQDRIVLYQERQAALRREIAASEALRAAEISETPEPSRTPQVPEAKTPTEADGQNETQNAIQTETLPATQTSGQMQTQTQTQPQAVAAAAPTQSVTQTQTQTAAQPQAPTESESRSALAVQEAAIIPLSVPARFTPGTASSAFSLSLEMAISKWLTDWQQQDLDNYLASYHNQFLPVAFPTIAAWQENRRRNIVGRSGIRLEVSDLQLINSDSQSAEVRFWLTYQSPRYSDETHKKLNLVQEDERWFILSEENLEVRNPSYRN